MGLLSIKLEAAVVVDPYSSGKYLLIELEKRNVPIIAVRSSRSLGAQFLRSHETNRKFFAECIDFEDCKDIDELVAKISALPFSVVGVFGGSEPGVELSDMLAEKFGMTARNSLDLLESRKDKAEMQETLRRNNLPAAEQFKSGELEPLLQWAGERNQWPVVAKPTGGAGSDGVYFCKSLDDLRAAHANIIGVKNPTGKINSELALQEFLSGDEYIVDTVSHEGKHLAVAIWKYTKRRGLPWDDKAILSSQNELLPASGEIQDKLVNYVFAVLDAVGLRYGPCHTEIMYTPRGPILVEVNARMHGLQGPRLIELATGTSKAAHTADVIIGAGSLFKKLHEPAPDRYLYPLQKQCVQLVLCSGVEGTLKTSIKDIIAKLCLPSVIEILPAVEEGGFINKTRDLATSPGNVLMVHESMEQIALDVARIRCCEEDGSLYEVAEQIDLANIGARRRAYSDAENNLEARERLGSHGYSMDKVEEVWAEMNQI